MEIEIWKPIKDFPMYEVSNRGQVRSHQMNYIHFLKTKKDVGGYLLIHLSKNNRDYLKRVHRLVLEAFIGECPKGYQTNHKDGIKSHNYPENLEWITPSENTQHAYKMGLINHYREGEKSANAKLRDSEVWLIKRLLWFGITQEKIAGMFKISKSTINAINTRRTWQHIKFELTDKDQKVYKKEVSLQT